MRRSSSVAFSRYAGCLGRSRGAGTGRWTGLRHDSSVALSRYVGCLARSRCAGTSRWTGLRQRSNYTNLSATSRWAYRRIVIERSILRVVITDGMFTRMSRTCIAHRVLWRVLRRRPFRHCRNDSVAHLPSRRTSLRTFLAIALQQCRALLSVKPLSFTNPRPDSWSTIANPSNDASQA